MAHCITRASNVTAHPGFVVCGPKHRSTEEVTAERQAKVAAMLQVEEKKAAGI